MHCIESWIQQRKASSLLRSVLSKWRKRFTFSSRNFKTTRYKTSLLFAGFNRLNCFANVKSSEADFALREGAVERRNNNDNYFYKFATRRPRASQKFDVNVVPYRINIGLVFLQLDSPRFILAMIHAKIFQFSGFIRTADNKTVKIWKWNSLWLVIFSIII